MGTVLKYSNMLRYSMNSRGIIHLGVLVFILIFAALGLVFYSISNNNNRNTDYSNKTIQPLNTISPNPTTTPLQNSQLNYTLESNDDPLLTKTYKSATGRLSFKTYPNWIVKNPENTWSEEGLVHMVQGPKQMLRLYENTSPIHAFDDFITEPINVTVSGKSFNATKWTSQSWNNSFVEVQIQESPYELHVEYGDAASVGFIGYDQEYDDVVDFEEDIKPIMVILESLKY